MVASSMGGKKYKPSDFDPRPDLSSGDAEADQNLAKLMAVAAARNARLEK